MIEALIAGGAALGGSGLNLLGSFLTNRTNKQIAADNNALAIELANSAYQRKKKDLEAAGLNPLLAIDGAGASVPQLQAPSLENPFGGFDKDIGSKIVSATKVAAEKRNLEAQNENFKAQNDLLKAQADNVRASTAKIKADTASPGYMGELWRSSKQIGADLNDMWHGITQGSIFSDGSGKVVPVASSAKDVDTAVKITAKPNMSNPRMRRAFGKPSSTNSKPKRRKHN